ncbi:MAG: PD-(D/E)XK nuclease family protein [Bacteroidota bacterium]
MLPFLQKTAQYLVAEYNDDLAELCIVLPNRRGGLFLRKYLAEYVGKPTWAPTIFSIEDFITEISGLQEVENLHLLFELYEVHREIEGKNVQPFEEFLRWASQLLSDFNEVDRYMADAKELFTTLTEARAISLWNLDNQPLTEFETKYLHFYQSLYTYYDKFTRRLLAKNHSYSGLSFRHAAENIESYIDKLPWRHILFAGFNALTKAEEHIITSLHKHGQATLLWDADRYYLNNRQQEAGDFLRDWFGKWPVKNSMWISDDFANSVKNIEIIGSPDPVGQVKYCGNILKELALKGMANEKTAIVLLDEGLLIPLLNSIPDDVGALNITAGMPLKLTPLASLFETVFHLHMNTSRFTYLATTGKGKFYYKDVLKLLQHPYIHMMANSLMEGNRFAFDETIDKIRQGHKIFVGTEDLANEKSGLFAANLKFLDSILIPWEKPVDALDCFKAMIGNLRLSVINSNGKMELEYLFAFSKIVHQLNNLLAEYPHELKIPAFYQLYEQVISVTSLPFYGEPLRGVQIMGMLETRTLDFENLIILSCNEDVLPSSKINPSFIPFDIKKSFDLPTYRHKDSVYAYHFYRLIQRALNIKILYNTEPDQLGGGDRSRFLRQIAHELPLYNPLIEIHEMILTSPPIKGEPFPVIEIQKTGETMAILVEKASKGFSATSLNAYRNCPLKFYFAEIAGIREPEDIGDTIDSAVLGSAVHEALNKLYKPFINQPITANMLSEMEKMSDDAINKAFGKKFKGSDIAYGKNLLLVNVAKLMVKRFLEFETNRVEELAQSGKSFCVVFLEQFVDTQIQIRFENREMTIYLKGFLDRVDKIDESWQIIDYKTGTAELKQLKVKEWEELSNNPDLNIGFQLLMYGYLFNRRFSSPISSRAGIISLRKINSGFIPVHVPEEDTEILSTLLNDSTIVHFENVIRNILENIYDLSKPFAQTRDLKICERCSYINLCGR